MLDSIRKPRTATSVPRPFSSNPERMRGEIKVWLSVFGVCVVILGVWVVTFQIPHPEAGSQTSELNLVATLKELNTNLKSNLETIGSSEQTSTNTNQPLSGVQLSLLAQQLVAGTTTSSTTLLMLPETETKDQT